MITLYGRDIYSFCLKLTGNRDSADELYQDTFLKASEKLDTIDSDGNLKSYLLSVSIRIWRNQKRKYAWRNRIAPMTGLREEITELPAQGDVLQDYVLREQRDAIHRAVGELPEKYRLPILLHYMETLSIPEIAEIMKIPQGTVKSRLDTARKQLRKELEGHYHEG